MRLITRKIYTDYLRCPACQNFTEYYYDGEDKLNSKVICIGCNTYFFNLNVGEKFVRTESRVVFKI